jgi:hypothetical protein
MKRRLFEDVVAKSKENRYLIAYAVATLVPTITNDGSAPLDLVLLSQRSLEKDIARRLASVDWPDFLSEDKTHQDEILLGLRRGQSLYKAPSLSITLKWLKSLEDDLDNRLTKTNIHCKQGSKATGQNLAELRLEWQPAITFLPPESEINVQFDLHEENSKVSLDCTASIVRNKKVLYARQRKPIVTVSATSGEDYPSILTDHAYDAFISESAAVVREFMDKESEKSL